MNKPSSTSIVACILLAAILGPGCPAGSGDEPAEGVEPVTQESRQERELRAASLYEQYRSAIYDEKIRGLTEVAHVYWDTPTGPAAARELIFYLLDEPGDDPATAFRELESLRRRRPETEELMNAAVIFTHAVQKRLLAEGADPKRELREKLFEKGKRVWIEVAEDLCNRPEYSERFDMHLEWGNGCMLTRDFVKAEAVWARVESFEELPRTGLRHRLLIKRANLLREHLDDDARSLELFEQAVALAAEIPDELDDGMRRHVSEAIADLKRKLGRD